MGSSTDAGVSTLQNGNLSYRFFQEHLFNQMTSESDLGFHLLKGTMPLDLKVRDFVPFCPVVIIYFWKMLDLLIFVFTVMLPVFHKRILVRA